MRTALVTGASGLLGRAVLRAFEGAPGWRVVGTAWRRARDGLCQLDITDSHALQQAITDIKPSVIIHCAAERKPDVVENQPEATKKLNVSATGSLCELAAAAGCWLLYLSTDYVFDGTSPPYKVTDTPNPLNKYGASKREGELVTLASSDDFAILRVPILYGEIENLGESAVTVLFEKVKDTSGTCVMSDHERRFPTHCDDVACVILAMANKQVENGSIKGIYHWSGDQVMTKYDMALVMATQFGIPSNHIQADKTPTIGAPRPYDSHLDCSRVEQELGIHKRTNFPDGIKAALHNFFP